MLEWIVSSSLLILVVLVLRAALGKRIGAGLRYGLWSVVLVRLLVPVAFFTLAVTPLPAVKAPEALHEESIYVLPVDHTPVEESGVRFVEDGTMEPFGDPGSFGYPRLEDEGRTVTRYAERISPLELLGWIWVAGTAVMVLILITANARFALRLRRVRRPLEGTASPVPVYAAPGLPSPCLTGLFRPAVYVTEEAAASPAMLRHVLAHELTHYNHRDHLWSVLRGAALAIHWWNPLVWLAVVCSRRDGELACDEGALKQLGDGERTAYGETLLTLVTAKSTPADLLRFSTTMTGGKRSLKERIQRIAVRPKRLAGAMLAAVAVLTLAAVCAFGRAEAKEIDPLLQPLDLCWNDSMETVIEKLGITEEQILYNEADEFSDPNTSEQWSLTVKDVPFLGYRATVGFDFIHYAGTAGGDGLNKVTVILPEDADMAAVRAGLIERYGEGEAGKTDQNYAYLTLLPDLPDPQPDKENHHMYWKADRAALPEGYEERVRDWLLNVRYKSADPEKIENYLAEAPMVTLHWTDDWLLVTDTLTTNRIAFDAAQLVEFLQNVPLDETEPVSAYVSPYDVNRDGIQEGTHLYADSKVELTQGDTVIWSKERDRSSESREAYFRCRIDGLDYLLEYCPKFEDGLCDYSYRLFHLEDGEEVTDRGNQITFDINFDSPDHRFDPAEIAAFMEEVNNYIAAGEVILGTSLGSLNLEREEYTGRLQRDNILVTLGAANTEYTTEEELRDALADFAAYAQDHPDDTWSPLADLLQNLTEDDMQGDPAILSDLIPDLRTAKRGSRFYTWDSVADAYDGHGVGERPAELLMELRMRDTSPLHLFANLENDSVLMMLDTGDQVFSAFYSAPELCAYIADFPLHVKPFSSTEPDINELLAHITKDGITSMGGGRGIIPRADIASALNSVSEKAAMSSEDREPETGTNGYKVWYHDDSYNWHILLEAGETTGDVYLTFEGTTMTPAILENPDPADLQSTPYKVVGFVNDETLYQLVVENR